MTVGRICVREVDLADSNETVKAAAQRMAARNVGTLVVLDPRRKPLGLLTDRDLALRVVGRGLDPLTTLVSEVMTRELTRIAEDTPIEDALRRMRSLGVRRMPVVDHDGVLVGIVSVDDFVSLLAEEFGDLGGVLARSSPGALAAV